MPSGVGFAPATQVERVKAIEAVRRIRHRAGTQDGGLYRDVLRINPAQARSKRLETLRHVYSAGSEQSREIIKNSIAVARVEAPNELNNMLKPVEFEIRRYIRKLTNSIQESFARVCIANFKHEPTSLAGLLACRVKTLRCFADPFLRSGGDSKLTSFASPPVTTFVVSVFEPARAAIGRSFPLNFILCCVGIGHSCIVRMPSYELHVGNEIGMPRLALAAVLFSGWH
jgi:hypothetical protein